MGLLSFIYLELQRFAELIKFKHFFRNVKKQRTPLNSPLSDLFRQDIHIDDILSNQTEILRLHTAEAFLNIFLGCSCTLNDGLGLVVGESCH